MSASTSAALPYAQWRTMNHLSAQHPRPAWPLLKRCDADVDDLLALWQREFIAAKIDDGDVDLGLLAHDRGLLAAFDIRVMLTAAGVRWVHDNPSNRALIAVHDLGGSRQGVRLTDATEKAAVDRETFLLLAHAGFVRLTTDSGLEMSADEATLRGFGKTLRVHLTALAVEVLG